jgi:hypothetical protein
LLVPSRSFCGGQTLAAINYGLARASPIAAIKVQHSSIRVGPAITLVSRRFQTASGSNYLPSSGRRQHVVASLLHDVKFTKKPLILAFNRLKLSFEFRSSV